MNRVSIPLALLLSAVPAMAQLSQDARFAILHSVIAAEGAARMPMPRGGGGLELTDAGQIDRDKLQKEIQKNGQSIAIGRVVSITAIEFGDKSIDIELDGGGEKKKSILSRIQVGVGGGPIGGGPQQGQQQKEEEARGSKITLKFAGKVPPTLTGDQLKELLNPVLDFNKQSVAKAGVDALPPEFKEAVLAKQVLVGMDGKTVRLALGAPNRKERTPGTALEDWIYIGRGNKTTFVTLDNDIVVSIREY
jgi:hypothetical protein